MAGGDDDVARYHPFSTYNAVDGVHGMQAQLDAHVALRLEWNDNVPPPPFLSLLFLFAGDLIFDANFESGNLGRKLPTSALSHAIKCSQAPYSPPHGHMPRTTHHTPRIHAYTHHTPHTTLAPHHTHDLIHPPHNRVLGIDM